MMHITDSMHGGSALHNLQLHCLVMTAGGAVCVCGGGGKGGLRERIIQLHSSGSACEQSVQRTPS